MPVQSPCVGNKLISYDPAERSIITPTTKSRDWEQKAAQTADIKLLQDILKSLEDQHAKSEAAWAKNLKSLEDQHAKSKAAWTKKLKRQDQDKETAKFRE